MSTFEELLERANQSLARLRTGCEELEAAGSLVRAERAKAEAVVAELRRRMLGTVEPVPPPVVVQPPAPVPVPVPPVVVPQPAPEPPLTPPSTPSPPFVMIDARDPGPFPGENSMLLQLALTQAAKICGLRWEVVKAIQVWETGHYKDPNARAWIDNHNPGGMLNTPFARTIGGIESSSPGEKYAEFPNWYIGVIAHGHFLNQDRYDAARATSDPLQQAAAIGAAGYAGGSGSWLEGVQALIRQYLRTGPSSNPRPVPSISTTRAAAVAKWRAALGRGIRYDLGAGGQNPTGPWSKTSDCSGFADKGLGISRDETGLNTDALVRDGKTAGGLFTQVSFDEALPADLLVVGAGQGHSYGHVAGITEIDPSKKGKDRIKAVIDCASGRGDDSIREGSPARLLERGAIVVRYHGLLA